MDGSRKNSRDEALSVMMVTPELPSLGSSMTGSPAHIYKTCRELESLGVKVSFFYIDKTADAQNAVGGASIWGRIGLLFQTLRKKKPDVLHCHGHKSAFFALLFAKLFRIPLVCEIHGLFSPSVQKQANTRPLLSRVSKLVETPTLQWCDHVIAQAQAMKEFIMQRTGVAGSRVTVIYPGLRVAEFADYRGLAAAIAGIAQEEKVIMYVGSTYAYQGLDLLAKAHTRLAETQDNISFVLVISNKTDGEDDVIGQYGFVPQKTKVVHLSDNSSLPSYLKRADVLVHTRPNSLDNLNVQSKLGLYLSAGKPIVTTNVGDYALLLADATGCIVVDPEEQQIAKAIMEAISNPEVATHASRDNRLLASKYFDSHNNANRLLSIYTAVIDQSSRNLRS
jgi:glycosyltransferase involved in cell wall biosynthesis